MKIGIITTSFPRWKQDYAGAFVYEAARALQNAGIQVKVVTMHAPGSLRHEILDGIEIYRTKYLPERWELLKSEGGGLPEVWKNNPRARIQIIPFMIAFLLDVFRYTRDCDLLHANWTLSGVITWMIHLFTRKPYVVTIHGSDIYRTRNWPLIIDLTRMSLRNAKKVIVVSRALAEVVNSIGIPNSNITVIPDGVDTKFFKSLPFEERSKSVLFVGSLIERKGIKTLIQAFSAVIKQFPNYQLIIIGEGPQRSECENRVHSLGMYESVFFMGVQTQDQVAEAMRKAKLFVLPSIEEGLGVVLLEALASGTPIVASKVGGISDIVDDKVGIQVPPSDPDQLANAITSILRLSTLEWNFIHQNACQRAYEEYDWTHIARRLIDLYNS